MFVSQRSTPPGAGQDPEAEEADRILRRYGCHPYGLAIAFTVLAALLSALLHHS